VSRKKKPTLGRPSLGEKARTSVFSFKLSEEEKAEIQRAADRDGLGVTTWARETLLTACRRTAGTPQEPANPR